VPALIHQYTQGNLLACAQTIEKLALISDKTNVLTAEDVKAQLIYQCEYQLYELADACLTANAEKALHLLRQANNNRTEPTLILWLLTQEVRQLIQLSHALKQQVAFSVACSQQKIWPQRANLYERTLTRLPLARLYELLKNSKQLDEQIKSNQSQQIWNGFEQLALTLCLG
jgi:DNA polymerase-3 subunit delta